MNKDQKIKFRDRHLRYQYELLHFIPSITSHPDTLSGLYLRKFYNSTKRYQLNLPPTLVDKCGKFCPQCGVVRVLGVNSSTHLSKDSDKDDTLLIYKCQLCKNETRSPSLGQPLPAPALSPSSSLSAANSSASLSPGIGKVEKSGNKAKARAKKRKMNNLSNLLSQKDKERKDSNKHKGLLSLESFMQK